jgi:hypothetical protein
MSSPGTWWAMTPTPTSFSEKLTRRYHPVTLCLDWLVGIIAESTLRSPIQQAAKSVTDVLSVTKNVQVKGGVGGPGRDPWTAMPSSG